MLSTGIILSRFWMTQCHGKDEALLKKTIGYSVAAACLLITILFYPQSGNEARGEDAYDKVQILFIGNTQALLEPCG